MTDEERMEFLKALDSASSELDLTMWENDFLDSVFRRKEGIPSRHVTFSMKEQGVIDTLLSAYEDKIGW